MPLGTTFRNQLLDHILRNANIANIGDATGLRGSSAAGNLYVALHTANPNAGDQTTSEATYTGYARVAIGRTTGFGAASGGSSSNAADVTFPECTAGSNTITYVSIGVAASGASLILWSGLITSLNVSAGITPRIPASNLDVSAT